MGSREWHIDIFDFHNNPGWRPLVAMLTKLGVEHTFHDATFEPEALQRLRSMREKDGNQLVPRVYLLHRTNDDDETGEVKATLFAPSEQVFKGMLRLHKVISDADAEKK
jgi:hypothetical protein